jgi:hypothetical protein
MPAPLFVVGKHRSGTTLLGNLLLDHPEVAGIQHAAHEGIHESAYFSHIDGRYGDLQCFENYVEFAAVMARSDYFTLAGVSFEELLQLYPATYAEVFRHVMDRVAESQDASLWVEKSPMHTNSIDRIGGYYPDAKFVGIKREVTATALSMLHLMGEDQAPTSQRLAHLLRVTVDKYILDEHMQVMRERWPDRIKIITFEDLMADRTTILSEVCAFLGIEKASLDSKYQKNTSFRGDAERTLKSHEKWLIRVFHERMLPLFPLAVFDFIKSNPHREVLPGWFFKLLRRSEYEK